MGRRWLLSLRLLRRESFFGNQCFPHAVHLPALAVRAQTRPQGSFFNWRRRGSLICKKICCMFASQQTYGNRNHFRHGQWEDLKNPFLLPSSTINLSIYLYVLRPVLHTFTILCRSVVDLNLTISTVIRTTYSQKLAPKRMLTAELSGRPTKNGF